MAGNVLFDSGREAFLGSSLDWLTDTIKIALIDLDACTAAIALTSTADNGNGLVRVVSATHGLTTGDRVSICGVVTGTEANGVWYVTVIDTTTFDLIDSTYAAAGTGGYVISVSGNDNWDDVSDGLVDTVETLTTKTASAGVADADDVTFAAVAAGNAIEAVIIYDDTGTPSTSTLIAFICEATGLPITPTGSDIKIIWDSGVNKIFKL